MALTPEEVIDLKSQLYAQVKNLPESKRKAAEAQIDSLSPEALESMIAQQKGKQSPDKPIFRKIIDGEAESIKIDENASAVAVMDIYPISKAHVIIIPKMSAFKTSELPAQAFSLAKKIAKRISVKYKAKKVEIQTENKFGEEIINILPSYTEEVHLGSNRNQPKKEELEEIAKKIRSRSKKIKPKIIKKEAPKSSALQMRRRIP